MTDFNLQDKVVYARGVKGTLIGKSGIIIKLYDEGGQLFAMVEFTNMGSFPCWTKNLDKE